jgi:hypothetical protein
VIAITPLLEQAKNRISIKGLESLVLWCDSNRPLQLFTIIPKVPKKGSKAHKIAIETVCELFS